MIFWENGARGRIRTTDTRIFSPLLYQLSYLGDLMAILSVDGGAQNDKGYSLFTQPCPDVKRLTSQQKSRLSAG